MGLQRLDHFFVYSADLERSREFYGEVLGLEQGPRPDFGFPGYWFYLEDRPVVHLGTDAFEGGYYEEGETRQITGPTGPVDHVAFRGRAIDDFIDRFESRSLRFERREIPDFRLSQLFIKDPDGVTIELNFFHDDD